MSAATWVVIGGLFGWAACAMFNWNLHRGLIVSVLIGGAGAFLGGRVLTPIFSGAASIPGEFSAFALVVAASSAAACLFISDRLYERFGL